MTSKFELLLSTDGDKIICHRIMKLDDYRVKSLKRRNPNKPLKFPSDKGLDLKKKLIEQAHREKLRLIRKKYEQDYHYAIKLREFIDKVCDSLSLFLPEYPLLSKGEEKTIVTSGTNKTGVCVFTPR